MASNTITKSLHKTMQTTVTKPFEDFLGKIRDIPFNIEYSCSSPNRFFSAALGASVKVIGNLVLSPTAFVMDYTAFLPNTIQNIVRGEENCPIGTCSSAVDQLMDNIDTYCVNDLGVDQRAYEGGESNAEVFTTTVGVYYGIKGICSLAESVAAWRNASGIARNASTAAEGQMTGGMGDAADDVVSGIVGDAENAVEGEMTGVRGDVADDVASGIVGDAENAVECGSSKVITNDVLESPRVGSALKVDEIKSVYSIDPKTGNPFISKEFPAGTQAHGFNNMVDNYAGYAKQTDLGNATLYQLDGALNGVAGRFEWIIQDGKVTHRMFIEGGTMNGVPIKK